MNEDTFPFCGTFDNNSGPACAFPTKYIERVEELLRAANIQVLHEYGDINSGSFPDDLDEVVLTFPRIVTEQQIRDALKDYWDFPNKRPIE